MQLRPSPALHMHMGATVLLSEGLVSWVLHGDIGPVYGLSMNACVCVCVCVCPHE